jgi:hypothetical protein
MTERDGGWAAPSTPGTPNAPDPPVSPYAPVPPSTPAPPAAPTTQDAPAHLTYPAYPGSDPYQNWGLAYAAPQPGYDLIVERPPRPGGVTAAFVLVYLAIVASAAETASELIYQWRNRSQLLDQAGAGPGAEEAESFVNATTGFGLVVGVVVWLATAAGVIVCTELARRGKNPARIVLASVLGALALYNGCGACASLAMPVLTDNLTDANGEPIDLGVQVAPWMWIGPTVVTGLAATAAILLITGRANRFFSPGPGRRFGGGQ